MAIEIDKDSMARAVKALQRHFEDRRNEELGNLEARFLVEHFVVHVGPAIYNQAVRDAQAMMQDKLVDIDGELFEPEPTLPE